MGHVAPHLNMVILARFHAAQRYWHLLTLLEYNLEQRSNLAYQFAQRTSNMPSQLNKTPSGGNACVTTNKTCVIHLSRDQMASFVSCATTLLIDPDAVSKYARRGACLRRDFGRNRVQLLFISWLHGLTGTMN